MGPILLVDPQRAWVIENGHADVFLVDIEDGAAAGPRFPLLRLKSGQVFCGMEAAGAGLLACISPEGSLSEVSRADLDRGSLEQWIQNLTAAATTRMHPRVAIPIDADQELSPESDSTAVRSNGACLWVQTSGPSLFLGEPDCPVDGPGWFPLAPNGWLELSSSAHIRAVDWERRRTTDPEEAGLHRFERTALSCFLKRRLGRRQQEASRLEARRSLDSAVMRDSLRELGSESEVQQLKGYSGSARDPLMAAVREVARSEGLAIVPNLPGRRPERTEDRIAAIAKASGFRARRVMLRDQWWKESGNGMLSFLETANTPVALLPRRSGFELFNPEDGTRTRLSRKVANLLSVTAFIFYRPFPRRPLTARALLDFSFHGCRNDLFMVVLLGLFGGALGMVTPVVTGTIFDSIIPGAQRPQLLAVVLFTLAAAISASLLNLARSVALLRMESRMNTGVQAAVWDRLLNLPASFFRKFTSGDLALRSLGINQIREMLTGSLTSSILSGIFSFFSFGLLFYYDWRLAMIATALVGIVVAVTVFSTYFLTKVQREIAGTTGRVSNMVLQFLNGIPKLRVSGAEGRAFGLWSREFAAIQRNTFKVRKIAAATTVFNAIMPVVSSIFIFYAVWHFAQDAVHPLTTGQFLAFNAAFGQFFGAALAFSSAVQSAVIAVPAFERARPILEAVPEVDHAKASPGELSGRIEINQIVFGYRRDAPPVLDGISISIQPGQFVALVGPSGCGKSTLFRLLLGFERPQSGAIYYDGQDLPGLDIQAVRKQIGTVLQTSRLMSGDIFRNIVGDLPLSIDDAWDAARLAGLDDDIRAMPMGMHTVIDDNGGGLSGGQRQRLMIARAIVSRPRILLFDEATSALDNQTQGIVTRSLEQLAATRIVIAHRLSTVMQADRIFVFNRGNVAEQGTYQELMDNNGLFAELAKRQLS